MPEIQPFSGTRYNPDRIADFARVVAPPYDVIDPEQHADLMARDPHNVVRLILGSTPGSPGNYEAAAELMHGWMRKKTLIRDPAPRFYILRDTFQLGKERQPVRRWAVVGRVRLEPFEHGDIYPHERTHSRPKEDRLRVMRAFGGNLSQVLALFDGDAENVRSRIAPVFDGPPDVELTDGEDVVRQMWVVSNADLLREIPRLLEDRRLYIADGHHRYETSLTYEREMTEADPSPSPERGYHYAMMALVGMNDPGLAILPIHRLLNGFRNFDFASLLSRLSETFHVRPLPGPERGILDSGLPAIPPGARGFILHEPSGGRFVKVLLREDVDLASRMPDLSPPVRRLEVTLVERFLMMDILGMDSDQISRQEHLEYYHDLTSALRTARTHGQVLVIMPPTSLEDLVEVTGTRERLPQKSTFFFPKLLSGLVFYEHGISP